jgi:hypothetical protein
MELDHVLVAVSELDAGAREFEQRYGLASVEGGRHPGWGTANRIVPLGETYLELIAVVDAEEAESGFGRWVGASNGAFGWAVRTDDIEAVAARHGLAVLDGSRARPDGSMLRWRLAGADVAAAEPPLPFFIQWDPASELPGRAPVAHPAGPTRLAELQLSGDPERLADWLGPHALPLSIRAGPPSVAFRVERVLA